MEQKIYKYFLCKTTQVEMMRDRLYKVKDEEKFFLDPAKNEDEKIKMFIDRMNVDININSGIYEKDDGTKCAFYISFDLGQADTREKLLEFVNTIRQNSPEIRIFGVVLDEDEEQGGRKLNDLVEYKNTVEGQGYIFTIFTLTNLIVNPTKHFLVPRHQLLSREEKNNLMKELNIELKKLPHILVGDPISKYYGAKVGDIFRIHRKEIFLPQVLEEEIVYRAVVEGEISMKRKKETKSKRRI